MKNEAQRPLPILYSKNPIYIFGINFNKSSLLETCLLCFKSLMYSFSKKYRTLYPDPVEETLSFHRQTDFRHYLLFSSLQGVWEFNWKLLFHCKFSSPFMSFDHYTLRYTVSWFSSFLTVTTVRTAVFTGTQNFLRSVCSAHFTEQSGLSGGFCQLYVSQRCLRKS